MNLGELLRKKRKEKGLTLEQVGKAIGVSKNTVSKYERNMIANMGNTKRLGLAKLLDIPPIVFIEALEELDLSVEQVSPQDFKQEVITLLSKTINIDEQGKALLLQTLNVICPNEE